MTEYLEHIQRLEQGSDVELVPPSGLEAIRRRQVNKRIQQAREEKLSDKGLTPLGAQCILGGEIDDARALGIDLSEWREFAEEIIQENLRKLQDMTNPKPLVARIISHRLEKTLNLGTIPYSEDYYKDYFTKDTFNWAWVAGCSETERTLLEKRVKEIEDRYNKIHRSWSYRLTKMLFLR